MFSWTGIDRRWLALPVALALHTPCQAGPQQRIFLMEDDSSAIHLSDRADSNRSRLLIGAQTAIAPPYAPAVAAVPAPRLNQNAIAGVVLQAALAQALDPNLLHAVIAVESGYAQRAVSPRGARGLMQLMPATARAYGVMDPFDADQNVRAGAKHLRHLLDHFGEDTTLALAAYNAGAAAVIRHGRRVPPYAETMAYVPRVLRHWSMRLAHQKSAAPLDNPSN